MDENTTDNQGIEGIESLDELSKEELLNRNFIVEVTDYASKGLSVTRIMGKVTFIPYVTPGDVVEIKIHKNRSRYMKAKPVKVIEPAEHRIEPKCPVFAECGGCWFQHVTYEKELETKLNSIKNTMKIIAKLQPKILDPIPSPRRERYRNHIQAKSSIKKDLGFFKAEKIIVIPFPKEGCLIIPEEMNEFVLKLNEEKDKITPHINFRIRQNYENNVYAFGFDSIEAPEYIFDKVGKYVYRIGMHNFFQINRYQIENWLKVILDYVGEGHNTIIDVYCGVGLISLPLSERAKEVIGIEINRKAIQDAIYSQGHNNIDNIKFISEDAVKGLKDILIADVIVIDPPRSGCQKGVIEEIVRINPKKIVYISCDPATFSRDCSRFAELGYELQEIQPVDMFPYTYHIEIISLLVKKGEH
jgi:23S rRNA (uracil1939-C5)-methyltransferase